VTVNPYTKTQSEPREITTLSGLNQILERVAHKVTDEEMLLLSKAMLFAALAGVIKRTPVSTGLARGGWQVTPSLDSIRPAQAEEGFVGVESGKTFDEGAETIASVREPYGIHWIANPVAYVNVLDQGLFVPENPGPSKDPRPDRFGRILVLDGYSAQAPEGMTDPAIRDIAEVVRD